MEMSPDLVRNSTRGADVYPDPRSSTRLIAPDKTEDITRVTGEISVVYSAAVVFFNYALEEATGSGKI